MHTQENRSGIRHGIRDNIPLSFIIVGMITIGSGLWAKYGMRCKTGHPTFLKWLQGAKSV